MHYIVQNSNCLKTNSMASDYKFICAGLNITKDATSNETGFKSLRFSTRQHSFIHSGHFYSAPSSPLLLRGAPDYSTDTILEFHAKAHRQLQVKDLPKVPTWRLERESNPRPSG